jgi:hypothetical protein
MSMKTVTVKLPEPLATWLAGRSHELGHTQSDLIRDALERLRQGTAGDSCHDAFADVCGSVRGPKDLSTHPRHMAGFGE